MSAHNTIGALTGELLGSALASGLQWDDAISALALAARGVARVAAEQGSGTKEACLAVARNRIDEVFSVEINSVSEDPALSTMIFLHAAAKIHGQT